MRFHKRVIVHRETTTYYEKHLGSRSYFKRIYRDYDPNIPNNSTASNRLRRSLTSEDETKTSHRNGLKDRGFIHKSAKRTRADEGSMSQDVWIVSDVSTHNNLVLDI